LAAVLVAGLLVGFGDGDEAVAKEPRATIGKIMLVPSDFLPRTDDAAYTTNAFALGVDGAYASFYATVRFPAPVVTVRRTILFGYDNSPQTEVCATMWRVLPARSGAQYMGDPACTTDQITHQKVAQLVTQNRKINTANQSAVAELFMRQGGAFNGLQVIYSY
jgi:hypothetical protein